MPWVAHLALLADNSRIMASSLGPNNGCLPWSCLISTRAYCDTYSIVGRKGRSGDKYTLDAQSSGAACGLGWAGRMVL